MIVPEIVAIVTPLLGSAIQQHYAAAHVSAVN
jgi:hypothetical protein